VALPAARAAGRGAAAAAPVKILVVTTSYPRHGDDAAGSFVAAHVAVLRAANHAVDVIAAGDPDTSVSAAENGGSAITRVDHHIAGAPPLFYGAGAPERFDAAPLAAWLAGAAFVARLLQALRSRLVADSPPGVAPDVIESHWLVPCALAVVALGFRGAHRAFAHSGDVARLEAMPGGAFLAARLVAAGATLIFASANLRARFAQLVERAAGPAVAAQVRAAAVEPASSPLCLAPPARQGRAERQWQRTARGMGGPVILGVGRLVPIKGYDRLVRATARLGADVAAVAGRPTLVILGEGPERARLEAMAARRGIDLLLPGQVAPAAVADWLALAEVFVHPCRQLPDGRTEGLPVALREALLAGLPVLATSSGGIDELAGPWAGRIKLLVDHPGDPGVYLAALSETLRSSLL
jgi:glycosyltransferase involved in cell wall biosynthesis